ncbi:tRNA (cytidine(34)-2'-O)-methyltransferase [Gammaproteobacteria bacterium]|nr:tRNA (cytidine(34)-2'-O)-methyltransferase [Gammaproteobacteria bacterium]
MFNLVLVNPQIPANSGNLIRLSANTGCRLHLVEPLGFSLEEKQLRRAGLDYHEYANLTVWPSWDGLLETIDAARLMTFSTHHQRHYSDAAYQAGDWLVFGSETAGLRAIERQAASPEHQLTLPMRKPSRSLNLANTASIVVYEAWRQNGFTTDPSPAE